MGFFNYTSYRFGPAPIHWDSPPGVCKWCGCCIYKPNGKPNFIGWHKECIKEFKQLFWLNETRKLLLRARGRRCEKCGIELALHRKLKRDRNGNKIPNPNWPKQKGRFLKYETAEHHHIVPLAIYWHNPKDPWAAWRLDNLFLLCHECHMKGHKKLRNITNMEIKNPEGKCISCIYWKNPKRTLSSNWRVCGQGNTVTIITVKCFKYSANNRPKLAKR